MCKWLSLLLLLAVPPVFASTALQQMERFITDMQSLQASFEQSVLDPQQRQATRSQGVFYMQRPGQFRWDYSEPDKQQIIADGRQIWLIDPELEQASVQTQSTALRGTPAMFLIGGDPVEQHFEVIDIGDSQGFAWVELIPRDKESQFVRVLLAFQGNLLQRMEMTDTFDQITRFQFYDIEQNPTFKPGFFVYTRPEYFDLYQH
ncbi:outer membrane lipoprotein chaperone LolA [Sedimenticola hydrogenitrophicus]|uniref:outer membrane lipoprotein chaperone LolA n=1 Tax=Sedimenticola hydrogenitrophicus TaxID=2967975 RepID=UPI0023B1E2CF|nr:outer membrane lipoprotein chaperone LolA [Sedimenticola hydrogenitrophicus]